ncbi:MAG TPA: nucleotidyl transferase AbiEii/AbiGii toxin family protein [Patescibacteria group bacterium]|nr:nucleotidyl transferase AbiEii/AbiGii toxin family protein [Patescibacteria group bacterium]
MNKTDISTMADAHKDPGMFRAAVNFTAAETRFLPRLIEKDYFCSLLLNHLAVSAGDLVFKGGTCLAKVYTEFYRLSEDLDFIIPTPINASRAQRRSLASGLKITIGRLGNDSSDFREIEPLIGANNSTQYIAVFGYTSLISKEEETIKIEVGLREPLLTKVFTGNIQTILLNPISRKPMVPGFPLPCLSINEALAEKLRAALSRREAAIRDFYDLDYAMRKMDLRPLAADMVDLVRQKLAVSGNDPIDVSEARLAALRQQLDSQLKPVLRTKDLAEFDLERAFKAVAAIAAVIGSEPS